MLNKKEQRLRRSRQTRERIAKQGVARLTVFRSNLHIYASVISEDGTSVVASASITVRPVESSIEPWLGSNSTGNLCAQCLHSCWR